MNICPTKSVGYAMLAIVRRGKKRREEGRRVVGALREKRRARLVVAITVTAGIWIENFYVKIFSPSFYQKLSWSFRPKTLNESQHTTWRLITKILELGTHVQKGYLSYRPAQFQRSVFIKYFSSSRYGNFRAFDKNTRKPSSLARLRKAQLMYWTLLHAVLGSDFSRVWYVSR